MNDQNLTQLVSLFRELQERRFNVQMAFTPGDISEMFLYDSDKNGYTGDIWQAIFLLSDEVESLLGLYDNSENGFFLSLNDTKKEEIRTSMIYILNSYVSLFKRLQETAPTLMVDTVFPEIEKILPLMGQIKEFLIDNKLYTGQG